MQKLLPFTLLVLAACNYTGAALDNTETGGPELSPDEVEDPPEWHCRERINYYAPVITLPGVENQLDVIVDARDAERCPYAVSSDIADPVPSKPYWWGLPNMLSDYYSYFINNGLNDSLDNEPESLHPMYVKAVADEFGNFEEWDVTGYDLTDPDRGGLGGNFPQYIGTSEFGFNEIPSSGLRPPIVTATTFDLILETLTEPPIQLPEWVPFVDPITTARYPAYGQMCSTALIDFDDPQWTPILTHASDSGYPNGPFPSDAECVGLIDFEGIKQHHNNYPFIGDENAAEARARASTKCLDNGKQYIPHLAVDTAQSRNGLVWINWGEADKLNQLVVSLFAGPEAAPILEQIQVFLDWAESWGYQIALWPLEASWPWSNWSYTGVCGYPASMGISNVTENGTYTFGTLIPCPRHYIPVLGDINIPELLDQDPNTWTLDGYCTLPLQTPPMQSSVTPSSVVPELNVGKHGRGFGGALFLEPLTQNSIDILFDALSISEQQDGSLVITANGKAGEDLLAEVNIPSGSRLTGTSTGASEESSARLTERETLLAIDQSLADGELVMLILESADRSKIMHRYIVPTRMHSRWRLSN